jgi:CPA2 family monovalent cation:H+ antiporter-2
VIVGESDFRHHIHAEVRPFRDVLLGLFFVTVGMHLDLQAAAAAPLGALAWTLVFLMLKPAIVVLIGRLRRWPGEESLRAALAIANGGEFGLLLLNQGLVAGLLTPGLAGSVLLGLVVSMALAPVLMAHADLLVRRLSFAAPARPDVEVDASAHELSGHVILCGCGRIGRPVAAALAAAGVDYVALEKDFHQFRAARDQGLEVLYADASRGDILTAAGAERCRLIVLTMLNESEAERILHWTQTNAPGAIRLANALDESAAARLLAAGAHTVFPESLAAGLGLADQALLLCGLDQDAAARVVTELRARLQPELRGGVGV